MNDPVILSCALTGAGDTTKLSPAVPVTPEEIARQACDAADAGASIVHIHVRDPATGKPSPDIDLYRETVDRIRAENSEVVINLTTGLGARFIPDAQDPKRGAEGTTMATPEARMAHIIELKPDICSLDVATFNFGSHAFVNIPAHLRQMAQIARDCGVKPEIEVFDLGHLRLANALVEEKLFDDPPFFQFCLGVPWGAPASMESLMAMRAHLIPGAIWSGFGIGRMQLPMAAAIAVCGGQVRVGLEDNLYLKRKVLAPDNASLVAKAREIIEAMGGTVATIRQARDRLGL